MAFLKDGIQFTGSINKLSAYSMRGSDKIILRTEGGADRKQIQNSPAFAATRNLNNEWRAVTEAAMNIRNGLAALKPLADYTSLRAPECPGEKNTVPRYGQSKGEDAPSCFPASRIRSAVSIITASRFLIPWSVSPWM